MMKAEVEVPYAAEWKDINGSGLAGDTAMEAPQIYIRLDARLSR